MYFSSREGFYLFLTFFAICLTWVNAFPPTPVVTLPDQGKVQGHRFADGSSVIEFLGIRYAEAPVGELRWSAPRPFISTSGGWGDEEDEDMEIFRANERVVCLQPDSFLVASNSTKTEDCLRVNVWVTSETLERARAQPGSVQVPVLVFIHGGAFYVGSGLDDYVNPKAYVEEQGLILVTLNYRLGALGFLAHPHLTATNPKAPTNFGLLDQRAALYWVKKNIKYFGGDPTKVTIAGESAGAISVLAHLKDPNFSTHRLFKRAIVMSATPYLTSSISLEASESVGRRIASQAGCQVAGSDPAALSQELACLRLVDPDLLQEDALRVPFFNALTQFPSGPVSDGQFDLTTTQLAAGRGSIADVDVIIGTCKDEGSFFAWLNFPLRPVSESFFERMIHNCFAPYQREGLVDGILDHYAVNKYRELYTEADLVGGNAVMQAMSDLITDMSFACPSRETLTVISKRRSADSATSEASKVYGYVWAIEGGYSDAGSKSFGIMHGSELPYFFGQPIPKSAVFSKSFSSDERELARLMTSSVAQFCRTGDPSVPTMKWIPFNTTVKNVIIIGSPKNLSQASYRTGECDFWAEKFPEGGVPPIILNSTDPLDGEEFLSILLNKYVVKASLYIYTHKFQSWVFLGGVLIGIFGFFLRYFFKRLLAVSEQVKAQQEQQASGSKKKKE